MQTPQFARGNVFANQPTEQQVQEQDKYKAFLKQQVPVWTAGGIFTGRVFTLESHCLLDNAFCSSLSACICLQIEEKELKRAEEKERIKLEEEKEEKRVAEQRARIQREYEEEQTRKKQKEMEVRS